MGIKKLELKPLLAVLFMGLFGISTSAQEAVEIKKKQWKTQLPTIITLHPLGTFLTQAQTNFGTKAEKPSFQLNINSGNVWLPKVTAYYPTNLNDEKEAEQYPWHFRGYKGMNSPDSVSFSADGVLRTYRVSYELPINEMHHIGLTANLYSLDGGRFPTSTISSDGFIEWFHSNVAGGEDPFARKEYELNQASIEYQDENGKELRLKNGDFGLASLLINYQYNAFSNYLSKINAELTAKVLSGINTTKFNRSMDLGLGISGIKNININSLNCLRIGINYEVITYNILNSEQRVLLINQNFISQRAFFLGWEKRLKNDRAFSISTLYQIQSSYRNPDATDFYALNGDRAVSHWHYAISHLYRNTYRSSLIFAYQNKKVNYGFYINQDLVLVDNAPDIQTGVAISLFLGK